MDFSFVMRTNPYNLLIYDGDKQRAKYAIDAQKAMEWWRKDDYSTFTFNKNRQSFEVRVPVDITGDGMIINKEFAAFLFQNIKIGKISDQLKTIWVELLMQYDVVLLGGRVVFRKKENAYQEIDPIIWTMKNFLYGFYRFDTISSYKLNNDGKKTDSPTEEEITEDYYDENPNPRFRGVDYTYQGKKYHTNLFGVYVPQFIESIFSKSKKKLPSGKLLQKWQRKFIYEMGAENYLMHSRGAGKSLTLTLISELLIVGQSLDDNMKARLINYFGQTDEANLEVIEYIQSTIQLHNQTYFEFKRSPVPTLIFKTIVNGNEKVLGRVAFRSGESLSKGRGGRPYAIIIDEAARIPEDVYEAALGNVVVDRSLLFCLSTIDEKAEKNWFYNNAVRAELEQLNYENTTDIVVKLWNKYGLDKVNRKEDLNYEELLQAREEFLAKKPRVCMRFTIEDIEWLSKETIDAAMKANQHKGEAFLLAEFYSVFADKTKLLDPSGLIDENMPERFERIVMGFDKGGKFDHPALVVIGLWDNKLYIIDSHILNSGMAEQIMQVKNLREKYIPYIAANREAHIPIAADVTQSSAEIIDTYVTRGLFIDVPVYYTGGKDAYWKDGLFHIGKTVLVATAQETFQLDFVRIASRLDVPEGLIDEIKNFGSKKTGSGRSKFEAISGKDDQVNAMMLALYTLYILYGTKETLMEFDINGSTQGQYKTYNEWYEEEVKRQKEEQEVNYNIFW